MKAVAAEVVLAIEDMTSVLSAGKTSPKNVALHQLAVAQPNDPTSPMARLINQRVISEKLIK